MIVLSEKRTSEVVYGLALTKAVQRGLDRKIIFSTMATICAPFNLLILSRSMSDTALKLRPLADRLLVEAISEDEVTKAGIILPDTVDKEKPEKGRVVALGSGKLLDNGQRLAWEVKAGDVVFFKKYAPDEIKVDDKEYLILSESDILAVLVQ